MMSLEGVFTEPTTSTPDLSLHISPPSISSSLLSNNNRSSTIIAGGINNYESQDSATNFITNSRTTLSQSQAHSTELSLGIRNEAGPKESTTPHKQNNHPYHYFPHLHHHSNNSTSNNSDSTRGTTTTTPLNHINYGVSLLDISSDGHLRPIKGIPVYHHNRSFPYLPLDHHFKDNKDLHYLHHRMCSSSYHDHHHHMPSSCYPSLSPSPSPYFATGINPTATVNGFSVEPFIKSHPLLHHHSTSSQYGVVGSNSEASSSGLMRSSRLILPKLPTKRSMRAPRMRWTSTLHARFVHAVELLGGHESKHFSSSSHNFFQPLLFFFSLDFLFEL